MFVARHGQATYAVDDVVTDAGGTLTDLGRHQAADLAERLVPERIAVVYPSRLDRAVQTGAIVATRLGTPIEVLDGVHEFAAGSLEGHHWDEALRRGCYDAWLAGELDERWPGGESGREIVDRMPAIESGFIRPLEGPGLGAALSPDLLARSDARVRLSGVRSVCGTSWAVPNISEDEAW